MSPAKTQHGQKGQQKSAWNGQRPMKAGTFFDPASLVFLGAEIPA